MRKKKAGNEALSPHPFQSNFLLITQEKSCLGRCLYTGWKQDGSFHPQHRERILKIWQLSPLQFCKRYHIAPDSILKHGVMKKKLQGKNRHNPLPSLEKLLPSKANQFAQSRTKRQEKYDPYSRAHIPVSFGQETKSPIFFHYLFCFGNYRSGVLKPK